MIVFVPLGLWAEIKQNIGLRACSCYLFTAPSHDDKTPCNTCRTLPSPSLSMSEENYDPFWDYAAYDEKQHCANHAHPGTSSSAAEERSPPELAPYVQPNRLLKRCAKALLISTCVTISTAAVLRAMSEKSSVNRYLQRYVYRYAQRYASQYLPRRILNLGPKALQL